MTLAQLLSWFFLAHSHRTWWYQLVVNGVLDVTCVFLCLFLCVCVCVRACVHVWVGKRDANAFKRQVRDAHAMRRKDSSHNKAFTSCTPV
jgi:hypothetical protein